MGKVLISHLILLTTFGVIFSNKAICDQIRLQKRPCLAITTSRNLGGKPVMGQKSLELAYHSRSVRTPAWNDFRLDKFLLSNTAGHTFSVSDEVELVITNGTRSAKSPEYQYAFERYIGKLRESLREKTDLVDPNNPEVGLRKIEKIIENTNSDPNAVVFILRLKSDDSIIIGGIGASYSLDGALTTPLGLDPQTSSSVLEKTLGQGYVEVGKYFRDTNLINNLNLKSSIPSLLDLLNNFFSSWLNLEHLFFTTDPMFRIRMYNRFLEQHYPELQIQSLDVFSEFETLYHAKLRDQH